MAYMVVKSVKKRQHLYQALIIEIPHHPLRRNLPCPLCYTSNDCKATVSYCTYFFSCEKMPAVRSWTQLFSWENVFVPPQKPWLPDRTNPEGTNSAIFGVGTAAKCCELKWLFPCSRLWQFSCTVFLSPRSFSLIFFRILSISHPHSLHS